MSSFNGLTGAVQGVSSWNGLTGALQGVSSFNGLTGAIGISAGSNITITQSGDLSTGFTYTINSTSALQGVSSFNGLTGTVQGVSSFNGRTGAVQGVSSWNGLTGALQGVSSWNGLTGAVVGASLGANIFTALNTFNAGISATGATFSGNISAPNIVNSFNGQTGSIGFTAGANITIIYSGITYTISSSGGGTVTGVDEARTWFL